MGEVVVVNCIEAREIFSPSMDHELIYEEELRLQEHLKGCTSCCAEMAEWQRLSDALQAFREQDLAAPPGFASAVMTRINSEGKGSPRTDWKRWKRAAIGTAAALLLAASSLAIKPDIMKVAVTPTHFENPATLQSDTTTNNQPEITTGGTQNNTEPTTTNPSNSDVAINEPVKEPIVSNNDVHFTNNQDHIVVSTFLKIKVVDASQAEARAKTLASSYSASIQSLGQQSEGDMVYLVDKISLESPDAAQGLIRELRGLGILTSQEEQKVDLNRRYSEAYEQLINLKNQRSGSQDTDQIQQLDKQIKELDEKLQTWDKQSSERTIVLWLQQQ